VKTVVLGCEIPSSSGGETLLFNLAGLVALIKNDKPDLVDVMQRKDALRRRSDYDGDNREHVDAMISYDEEYQREIVRFAVDESVDLGYCKNSTGSAFEAVIEMQKYIAESSVFLLEFLLQKGDVIMIDNGLLAHGRKAYASAFREAPRKMVRGKYLKLPS
jgi:hypothetical protein